MPAFDKKQMDAIVSRFLGWKLPKTFSPDCWISFSLPKENHDKPGFWPVGTNLLTADEARAMLEHVLDVTFIPDWSLLEATQASLREHMAMVRELRDPDSIRAFLHALQDRNEKDCGLFPQVAHEVEADAKALRRVLAVLDFYHPPAGAAASGEAQQGDKRG